MKSDCTFENDSLLITLHHKNVHNRTLPVHVVLDASISAPYEVDGTWAVPCDVVGLSSKKAKFIKFRFHPSLPEMCKLHRTLADIARREANQFLSTLLMDSDWSMTGSTDHRPSMLRKIAHFLLQQNTHLAVYAHSLDLLWPLHSSRNNRKTHQTISDARPLLSAVTFVSGLYVEVSEAEDGSQLAVVGFRKNDMDVVLLRLELENSNLETGVFHDCWKVSDYNLCLRLPRLPIQSDSVCPPTIPILRKCTVVRDKQEIEKMLNASQLRVDDLRRRLDESLALFQKSAAQKTRKARSLHIVRVTASEAMVEVGEHSARPVLDRLLASSSPLNVICDGGSGADLASSPAESTDSGVSLSPVSSPVVGKQSPFYQYSEENRLGQRQRSQSESDWASGGLKGILKKPTTRIGRFSRSVSECHQGGQGDQYCLMRSTTVEEIEEEEEEGENGTDDGEVGGRKKRVSFSEKLVQLRRFKSGQCILAKAKKNEKKRLQKKRKEEERQRSMSESHSEYEDGDRDDNVFDSPGEKAGMRASRQDSGFVDGEDEEGETDSSGPAHSSPEQGWKQLIKQQRQAGVL